MGDVGFGIASIQQLFKTLIVVLAVLKNYRIWWFVHCFFLKSVIIHC